MAVEGIHLVHVGLDAGHIDGMVGADDGDAPLTLELLYPGELGIVSDSAGVQCLAQLGVAAIDERGDAGRTLFLAVAMVAGEHHHGMLIALREGAGEFAEGAGMDCVMLDIPEEVLL